MIAPTLDSFRVFLHVLAAGVWVGGQIVVAGVAPALRKSSGSEGTKTLANGFARVAWPAFGLALITGVWGLIVRDSTSSTAYSVTFGIKFLFYIAAGASAVAHARSTKRPVIAVTGALGLLFSLTVMFLGSVLAQG
jgi:putative copper export protein